MMHSEMHEVQPLMHLLSTYVIKPIAFDANPYVLPRAAQFVKYGGANKYFQKHGSTNKQPSGIHSGNFSNNMGSTDDNQQSFNRKPGNYQHRG